jgi:hypothetical protein
MALQRPRAWIVVRQAMIAGVTTPDASTRETAAEAVQVYTVARDSRGPHDDVVCCKRLVRVADHCGLPSPISPRFGVRLRRSRARDSAAE